MVWTTGLSRPQKAGVENFNWVILHEIDNPRVIWNRLVPDNRSIVIQKYHNDEWWGSYITLHDSIKPAGLVRRGVVKFVWKLSNLLKNICALLMRAHHAQTCTEGRGCPPPQNRGPQKNLHPPPDEMSKKWPFLQIWFCIFDTFFNLMFLGAGGGINFCCCRGLKFVELGVGRQSLV